MSAPMIGIARHVAACDTCGAVLFIPAATIPERDTDLDDAEHDNRMPIGQCCLVYNPVCGESAPCGGLVYYIGETTLAVTV